MDEADALREVHRLRVDARYRLQSIYHMFRDSTPSESPPGAWAEALEYVLEAKRDVIELELLLRGQVAEHG